MVCVKGGWRSGRLISCEECARGEENSLGWYVRNFLEVFLQGVRVTGEIESDEIVSKDEFKTFWKNKLKLDS